MAPLGENGGGDGTRGERGAAGPATSETRAIRHESLEFNIEFLVLLYIAHWPALYPPLRETLPAVFDGVPMAPGQPDEDLYDGRGRRAWSEPPGARA